MRIACPWRARGHCILPGVLPSPSVLERPRKEIPMSPRAAITGSLLISALAFIPTPGSAQPTAQSVAASVQQALGGKDAWDKTRYLHWPSAGRRSHWWDKWTGRYRLEG